MKDLKDISTDLYDKLYSWLESALLMLPNFVLAVLTVLGFALLAKLVRKGTKNVMSRSSDNEAVNNLIGTIIYVAIILAGCFVALGVLDLQKTVTSLLAGVGVLGLALGFAFQNTATNFISGVLMAAKYPLRAGDQVECNGHFGTVQSIGLRYTSMKSFQGQLIVIPNKDILESSLVNYTIGEERRVDLEVGVSYSDDLDEVERTVIETIEGLRVSDNPVEVMYHSFGDSSINFTVRFWLRGAMHKEFLTSRSLAVKEIKKAFDKKGISIPFPIRTLELGNGQVEKLAASIKGSEV